MKTNTFRVTLLSMLIISLMQSCRQSQEPNPNPVPDTLSDTVVTIKLKSIKQNGEYHLKIKDSKGGSAIDDLETRFKKKYGEPGTIIWKDRFLFSKIKSIDSIYTRKTDTEIFKLGTTRINKKKIQLELPLDIPEPGTELIEEYYIDYTPRGEDEVKTIDPFIRITE